ncbi:RhoGAP domain-containing protein [Colletotrichum scovillei]|uniref:RhoGAP domain-containing protein n=1 Tax=Colletotrichum simmondsii TaxID=703756 RepID=A0A135TLR2_9PEZI|nr:RhoGAP domain-containing protein [Colletotrichum scovillei]KAF4782473.1 RhoGAP domain-containing protein [Colletotrichum scovillei]KAJ3948092.1 Rho-type GTPase activating protein Rga1 [Colletotrichum fioriniae]KXH49074.1 RhoGAP domain-containing protein [Colletotrichum simmondsii]
MASDYDHGAPDDRLQAHPAATPMEPGYPGDGVWQNGGRRTPERNYRSQQPSRSPGPRTPGREGDSRRSGERSRSKGRGGGRSASGQQRTCKKCGEPLTGQFVRALDGTFHLDCFKCRDCGQIVASKFFPVDDEGGEGQYPLCETDYFRRLGLLCFQCGGALRGSYITALDRKYHVDHFTCSLCPTVFGAQDSYYEHDGNVYCHYHYSTQFAQRCNGCQTAILKQFVEIYRNGQNQHWHPECYMIHKFWNVRLTQPSDPSELPQETDDPATRDIIREEEERMEEKVYRIWSVLSTFEESSAACISDMLLHVSNGAYVDGVLVAKKFIWHVEILFQSADRLDYSMDQLKLKEIGLSYGREAKLLCKKIVSFFSLLSKTQDTGARKLGVTQELLSLVTGLAHYLKLLIRICLQGALRLEKESKSSDGIYQFLDDLSELDSVKPDDNTLQAITGNSRLSAKDSDHCALCNKSVEDECAKNSDRRWHIACVSCSRCTRDIGRKLEDARYNAFDKKIYCNNCIGANGDDMPPFEHVTKLQQYVFLLKVALARLLDILRSNGALPRQNDDQNSDGYGPGEGARTLAPGEAPYLNSDNRSKSYAGDQREHNRESSYENTLNDVRRLRSTRLDKHLSSSFRKARTSRIMDGPEGRSVRPGSAGEDLGRADGDLHILEERRGPNDEGTTDKMFNHQDALTLDDIPRIVAAEQVKEQQYKPNRQELFRSPATDPMGHQRSQSAGREAELRMGDAMPQRLGRKYFSELSGLEYFIVRHLAVLTLAPAVENEFPLEELLSFIESRKQPTFWKNLGKAFKNDRPKNVKKKGIFGVPLDVIIDKDGAESTDGVGPGTLKIPAIIDDLISSMRKMDLSVEGVFRKNGNIKKLSELCERIDREGCDSISFMDQPVVQVAALLKRYLRELPDPLLTFKLQKLWISVAKIQDDAKRKSYLHLICCLLPKAHRDCLEILFCFLKWAGSFHQVDEEAGSRMDIKNLATVIAPNILYNSNKAPALDSDPMFAIVAVNDMITSIEEMCLVPDELMEMVNDPFVFGNTADLTTKDILKRYQDRMGQRPGLGEVNEVFNRPDNSSRPPPRRVETDPALWQQQESSVRTVQEPPMPIPPFNQPNPGTPPQRWRPHEENGHPSPYGGSQYEHSDTEGPSEAQKREWRQSGGVWGRQNSGVGVGGNT